MGDASQRGDHLSQRGRNAPKAEMSAHGLTPVRRPRLMDVQAPAYRATLNKKILKKVSVGSQVTRSKSDDAILKPNNSFTNLARHIYLSDCTGVLATEENRRKIFSSDTMMKFTILSNELHNIKYTTLKRTESELANRKRRMQRLEEDLERFEERLATINAKLTEVRQSADESDQSDRIREALKNMTIMDHRVAILEAQFSQAKLCAEESDKKYEEVARGLRGAR